jgi:hypothetical protein
MKLVKTASGKQAIKMSRKEWEALGKKAGWMKMAAIQDEKRQLEASVNDLKIKIQNIQKLAHETISVAEKLMGA